jgi:AcrR family transcriptional regulator
METKETLTRNYIFEAFYELLSRNNINDINVSEICEKAGVSRMSFYRNFKSKEDLINKSLEKILLNLKESLLKQDQINQYIVTREIFSTALKYTKLTQAFKNSDYIDKFISSIADQLFTFSPEDKINPTKKYVPIFYFSALTGVLAMWLNNDAKESPEEMARFICSIAEIPMFSEDNIHIN